METIIQVVVKSNFLLTKENVLDELLNAEMIANQKSKLRFHFNVTEHKRVIK